MYLTDQEQRFLVGHLEGGLTFLMGDYETALKEWRPLADQGDPLQRGLC